MGSLCNKIARKRLSPEEEQILKSEKELELFEVPCHKIVKSVEYISERSEIDLHLIPNWLESIGIDSKRHYGEDSKLGSFFKELSKAGKIQKIYLEVMGVLLGQGITVTKSALLFNMFVESSYLVPSEVEKMLQCIAEVAVKLVLISDSSLESYYNFIQIGIQSFVEAHLAELCQGNNALCIDEFSRKMTANSFLLSTSQIRQEINKQAKIIEGIPRRSLSRTIFGF